jgi:hypothetical protein
MAVIPIAPACSPPPLAPVRNCSSLHDDLLVVCLDRRDLCVYYLCLGTVTPSTARVRTNKHLQRFHRDKHACLDLTVDVFGDQVPGTPSPRSRWPPQCTGFFCMWSVPPPLQYISCLHEKKRRQAHIWILRPLDATRATVLCTRCVYVSRNTSARVDGTLYCRSGTDTVVVRGQLRSQTSAWARAAPAKSDTMVGGCRGTLQRRTKTHKDNHRQL